MRAAGPVLALSVLAALAGCADGRERAADRPLSAAELAALPGVVTFASERDGARAVYRVEPGRQAVRLSVPGVDEVPLAVSPDGAAVVAGRAVPTPDGALEQLVLYDGGAFRTTLTVPQRRARNPTWTASGDRVVFESDLQSFSDLYAADRRGGGLARLTDAAAGNFEPSARPSDGALAFVSSRDGQAEVYTAAPDGARPTRLPGSPRDDWAPRWSPDGRWVLLTSDERGRDELYLVRPDGTGRRRLNATRPSAGELLEGEASWAPDGRAVAYSTTDRAGRRRVWTVDVGGGDHRALTDSAGVSYGPAWSPDGAHLAFVSEHGGSADVYVMRRDGTGRTPLSPAPGHDDRPLWSRRPGPGAVPPEAGTTGGP